MRESYEIRAMKFIRKLAPLLIGCQDVIDYANVADHFNATHRQKLNFDSGLTRVVFITSDYVIKLDCGYQYNIDTFGSCEKEMAMYWKAEADGMAYLFAKITPYVYEGRTYYIMPRIYHIGEEVWDADHYMNDKEYAWCRMHHITDLHNMNYGWRDGHICIIDYGAYKE